MRPARVAARPVHCGVLVATVVAFAVAPARADVTLVDRDHGGLTLGGYVRAVESVQSWRRIDLADLVLSDPIVGQTAGVARLEWTAQAGDRLTLDLHQRIALTTSSQSNELLELGGVGVGVSRRPERNVDLSTDLIDGDGLRAEHDIDRLSARLYLRHVDLYVGRQAVGWGSAVLFAVADLWTQFSPFELDTAEKAGVDAVRAIAAPTDNVEIEAIVVDRGDLEDIGLGVRTTLYRPHGDVWFAAAKSWTEVLAMGGWSRDLSTVTLRGDAVLPLDYYSRRGDSRSGDSRSGESAEESRAAVELQAPRVTVGLDYFRERGFVTVEYHVDAEGAVTPEGYADRAASAQVARGEVYLLGRHYVGVSGGIKPTSPTTLALTTLVNVADPSAVFAPSFLWQAGEAVDLTLGAYVPVGATPTLAAPLGVSIESELGSAPVTFYGGIALYY